MNIKVWLGVAGMVALYVALVLLVGFPGFIAVGINFARVAATVAVLIIFIPAASIIFREMPPPRRDYLLTGIILIDLSAVGFSLWNEAGRIFHVDTSVFSNPIPGFFALLLAVGTGFLVAAPGTASRKTTYIAVAIGAAASAALVFIAPLFR